MKIRLIEPEPPGMHVWTKVLLPRLGLPIIGAALKAAGVGLDDLKAAGKAGAELVAATARTTVPVLSGASGATCGTVPCVSPCASGPIVPEGAGLKTVYAMYDTPPRISARPAAMAAGTRQADCVRRRPRAWS